MTADTAIEARDAVKAFGQGATAVRALDNVSITIRKGEFFTLLGPSGCGKTTLLRLIAGFETPTSGQILLDGQDITHLPPNKRPVNTVFQSYALFPHLTVAENVGFGLMMQGRPKSEVTARTAQMLALVKMEALAGRKTSQLSGGQQQRVALARALAPEPKVLLLDEPLSALDLQLRKEMQIELKRLQHETGITFVFVTHDQEEALTMSDRIGVMSAGKLLQVGTPRDIYDHPATAFVAGFVGTSNMLSAERSQQLLGVAEPHSIRPERLRIVQHETGDTEISVPGVVSDIQYLGADCRVRVQLDDGTHLIASVPSDGLAGVAIGGSVRLAWSRYAAFPVAKTEISKGGDS